MRIGQGVPVFMVGVLEFLCFELLDLASTIAVNDKEKQNITKDGSKVINPRHIMMAVRSDQEFSRFFKKSEFHNAGRMAQKITKQQSGKKKKKDEEIDSEDEELMDVDGCSDEEEEDQDY